MLRNKLSALSFVLVFILILSAVLATPAYADEAPPPEDVTTEEQVDEMEAQPPVEEEATPPSTGETESAPLEESTTDEEQPILEQLPENTELIVLDEEGETLPLVTEEAQQIFSSSDPMWCPAGKTPIANVGGCSDDFTTFSDLLAWLQANDPGMAGTIWIHKDYNSSTAMGTVNDIGVTSFTLNGGSGFLDNMANFALTIQGGWTGTGKTINTDEPSDFVGATLSIDNWNAPVTINDISLTGATSYGLFVETTGNVVLKNVQANNNGNYGAYIVNDGGTSVSNVTITKGTFNNNTNGGLYVSSKGTVTASDLTTNVNTGIGAYLQNSGADTPKAVTLTGTNTFNNNTSSGLAIDSIGVITINNLIANDNGFDGANINNLNFFATNAGVKLTGTNIFGNNANSGLSITSKGAVTLNNIYANSNTVYGAYIDNDASDPIAQNVTFSGTNEFKYNGSTGLIISTEGAVLLNNITASTNNFGVSILNNLGTAAAPVTIKGTNSFKDNVGTGLNIQSFGIVTLNNITADGNGTGMSFGYGVSINNSGLTNFKGVTITGTNSFNNNYNNGLVIASSGAVTLNNLTANNNISNAVGAAINNYADPLKPMAVTLNGTNTFNMNDQSGLYIATYGAVTLNNIKANDNGQGGLTGNGVYIDNVGSNKPQNVTIKGVNEFNNNYQIGLSVTSKGNITTNSVTANLNGNRGVDLTNNVAGGVGNVTMTGTNFFSGNVEENLNISSLGMITLNNITANSSVNSHGVNISNVSALTPKNVTINGTNTFTSNNDQGLVVSSIGVITVNNLNAADNGSNGVFLYNINSPTKAGVNVNGTNNFNSNTGYGLRIWTLGHVKTNSINASSNTNIGFELYGIINPNTGNVTMSGNNFFNANGGGGIQIDSYGIVTLNNITVTGSTSGHGLYITNSYSDNKAVILNGTNVISNNGVHGLLIVSYGTVTINNLTADNNTSIGASIQNNGGTTPVGVTLNGTNKFDNNGGDNLNITSDGLIKINNLTSTNSGNMGAALVNSNGTAGVTITGTNNYFDSNSNAGLYIASSGVVTLSNITSTNSSDMGAQISNTLSGFATPKNVTLTGTNNFSGNALTGLEIRTYGSVTINNLTANNNGSAMNLTYGEGVDILNYQGNNTIVANVTLTGNNTFNGNYTQGLKITSFGAIKANNVTASTTTTSYGAWLDTSNAPTNAYGVTLSGTNKFEDNGNDGLHIDSKGTVLLNNLTITLNGSNGMYVNNTYAGANTPKPVTITGTNNFSNNVAGFYINSYGAVTLSKVTSSNNTSGSGGVIDNSATNVPSNVTVTGYGVFNNNTGNGLLVISKGAVTLTNITTIGNTFSGLDVNNNAGTGNVTITGTNIFTDNGDNGATINSTGHVSITKVTGDDNGQSGLYVTTTGTVTMTCGSFNMNNWYGWEVDNATLVTLKGVFTASNLLGDYDTTSPLTISRACPLP